MISQLVDDTILFLKYSSQIPQGLNIISVFSMASGLHLNVQKCELLSVKDLTAHFFANIPILTQ